MPAFEVLALDTATPQARAPGSGDTYLLPRQTAVSPGTLTASGSVLSLTATWNAAGVTMPGALTVDVTDTASAAGSLLADFRVGGATRVSIGKDGKLSWANAGTVSIENTVTNRIGFSAGGGARMEIATLNFVLMSGGAFAWSSSSGSFGQQPDLYLYRIAANHLGQHNGTNAQQYSLYGTFTDASNFRRVEIAMTTAGVASIKPAGAGTGASGNVLHISGLPTSNPGPGILWNNAGTPAIGT